MLQLYGFCSLWYPQGLPPGSASRIFVRWTQMWQILSKLFPMYVSALSWWWWFANEYVAAAAAAAKSLQSCPTVRPHRQQPTRLHCPWDSPGKNTGVGCHFLLQCMKVKSESEVAQSCPTLRNCMNCSLPGSSFHGILQARGLVCVAIAFSGSQTMKVQILGFHLKGMLWNFLMPHFLHP